MSIINLHPGMAYVALTQIDIDEDAVTEAMRLSGAKTKKDVNLARREFAARRRRLAVLEHYAALSERRDYEGWQRQRAAVQSPAPYTATPRTAARIGADVRFEWDDPATHSPALVDIDRVYLVAPVMRMDFAGQVSSFLDLAEAAGVRHVTYLSAFGTDQAPPEVARHGSRPNNDVQHVTGVPPASLADFARRTAHAWAWQGAR